MLSRQGMRSNNKIKFIHGFTLIELLVAVAIIGILSAIVFLSFSSARDKTADSVIMQDLKAVQTQAELFFQKNKSYTLSGDISGVTCPGAVQYYGNLLFKNDSKISEAITHAMSRVKIPNSAYSSFCGASPTSWVAAIRLKTSPLTDGSGDHIWCVDSAGNSKQISGPLGYGTFSDFSFPIQFICP